jgi:hypothetical protein
VFELFDLILREHLETSFADLELLWRFRFDTSSRLSDQLNETTATTPDLNCLCNRLTGPIRSNATIYENNCPRNLADRWHAISVEIQPQVRCCAIQSWAGLGTTCVAILLQIGAQRNVIAGWAEYYVRRAIWPAGAVRATLCN